MKHSDNFIKVHAVVSNTPQYINYMLINRMFPTTYETVKATLIEFWGDGEVIVKESVEEIFKLMNKKSIFTIENKSVEKHTVYASDGSISAINSSDVSNYAPPPPPKPKQQEITDEEIYKESFKEESPIWHKGFLEGAKWYREQLKQRK